MTTVKTWKHNGKTREFWFRANLWQERRPGAAEPSSWALWYSTRREAAEAGWSSSIGHLPR